MNQKKQIVELFRRNVKGQKPNTFGMNLKHDGKEGHWLEKQFGIGHNASNAADLLGYELKNQTTSKTSFGDWSANEYIYNDSTYFSVFNEKNTLKRRNQFLKIFGKPNEEKGGRYSWSGETCPKINNFNTFGQRLMIVENNDIIVEYSYTHDTRLNKDVVVPDILKRENLVLARWYGNSTPISKKGKCLKKKVEDKFNDKGWFTCKTDERGVYCEICFGNPMTFDNWINLVKKGIVFFDSGMYETNKRPYSQWRANNDYWDSLIVEKFN